MTRLALAVRIIAPTLWVGMIIALSFLEAPLKFQAPGITVPLGLGIGRLMFTALTIAAWVLLVATTTAAFAKPRLARFDVVLLASVWLVLAIETFVIRPPLNARSDIIIAGGDPGESWLHYGYVATEGILVVLLVVWVVRRVKTLPLATEA